VTTRAHDLAATAPLGAPPDVDTPALLVDLDILDRNLTRMAEACRAAGIELYPHAKTHRVPELAVRQLERGANGLCVAKLGEAEAFAEAGAADILVAYPLVGAAKLERAVALAARVRLTLAVDSAIAAFALSERFARDAGRVRTMLLVDSGLGRCGVPVEDAPALAAIMARLPGIEFAGILTHEGHVYGARDRGELSTLARGAAETMRAVAAAIDAVGVTVPAVSLGSSASAAVLAEAGGPTQLRPGIYAFNDRGQVALGNARPEDCAARVLATVVSRPDATRGCLDAGSKALSSDRMSVDRDGFDGFGTIVGHPGWRIERLSEEHGWLRWAGDGMPTPLVVGDRVEVIPNHICSVFHNLGEVVALRGGAVDAVWRTIGAGASR
jgi:Predicted amino acid aldolase or racemase